MGRLWLGVLVVFVGLRCGTVAAAPAVPDGTWLISQRIALDIYACKNALCGRVVWLRNPALRTPELCGRVIVWGLTPTGQAAWGGGSFFDPENGNTYDVSAHVETSSRMTARIYQGIGLFGRTEILTRIADHSLAGWCAESSGR